RRGIDVEVWNAGFPGWTSLENLIALAIRDRDLQPDWIILFQGINDLQPATHQPFDRQYEQGHADSAHRTLGFDLQPPAWHQRSLLLETLSDALWGASNPWDAVDRQGSEPQPLSVVPEAAVVVFERNLRSFAALSQDLGARLVLVPQTLRLRQGHLARDRTLLTDWLPGLIPDAAKAALDQLTAVEQRLAEEGVGLFADPAFDTWPDAEWDDAMHFSASGSERFASFLEGLLVAELSQVAIGGED
ncbi:MAG: SGNH/GDSL hydrolase family protein, partial [Acidobacteriota bacterium]